MKKVTKLAEKQFELTASVVGAFVAAAISSMLFVKLAWDVREYDTLAFDEQVLLAINGMSDGFLDAFVPVATDIGGVVGVTLLTLIAVGAFVYKKEYIRAIFVALGVGGVVALNLILKAIFERARPNLWEQLVVEPSYSFPSGHAMASAALGLVIVVALWDSRWRWWACGAAAVYILFVGFSRLYLGVHYPTDVIAGWLVSGAWVMAVALLLRSKLGHQALRYFRQLA